MGGSAEGEGFNGKNNQEVITPSLTLESDLRATKPFQMKQAFFILICFFCVSASGQENQAEFDGRKWEAPYFLDTLKGWGIERFLIPIGFAPSIPYKGVEDIRFAPGWSKKESGEYWSYAFLWYLEGLQRLDPGIVERNLVAYYTGLANVNVDKAKVTVDKLVTIKASIKESGPGTQTFEGTVDILDYMTLKPISLNVSVRIKYCKEQDRTFVFHELSPQPYSDKVWGRLNYLWATLRCTKE